MINFVHLCGFLIRQNSSFYTLQCPSGFFPCHFSGVDPPALSSAVEILGHLENIETASPLSVVVCVDDFNFL